KESARPFSGGLGWGTRASERKSEQKGASSTAELLSPMSRFLRLDLEGIKKVKQRGRGLRVAYGVGGVATSGRIGSGREVRPALMYARVEPRIKRRDPRMVT